MLNYHVPLGRYLSICEMEDMLPATSAVH